MTEPEGKAAQLRCPYHGWTYSLEGELKGTPDFSGVCDFDRAQNGLVPLEFAEWENWVFVKLDPERAGLSLGIFSVLIWSRKRVVCSLNDLHWFERRHYQLRLQLESVCR